VPTIARSFWTALLAVLALVIGVLALTPHPPPTLDTGWDKLNHVLAFAALAFCAQHAAQGSRWPAPAWQGGLLAYGVLIEIAQTLVPGRHGEWPDLLADAVGIALGMVAAWLTLRKARRAGLTVTARS
jgi:VanZ family protein